MIYHIYQFRRIKLFQPIFIDHSSLNIQRNINPYRTGTSGKSYCYRFIKFIFDIQSIGYGNSIFGNRFYDTNNISLLISQLTKRKFRIRAFHGTLLYLTGYIQSRNGIEPLSENPRYGISPARTCRDICNA